jgi:hypothetical protein
MFTQAVVFAALLAPPPDPPSYRVAATAAYELSVDRTGGVRAYCADAGQLAAALGLKRADAEAAARRALRVERIDWSKYAVVVVSEGVLSAMAVSGPERVFVEDGRAVVWYRVVDAEPRGRRHPARVFLLERPAEPVEFRRRLPRYRGDGP